MPFLLPNQQRQSIEGSWLLLLSSLLLHKPRLKTQKSLKLNQYANVKTAHKCMHITVWNCRTQHHTVLIFFLFKFLTSINTNYWHLCPHTQCISNHSHILQDNGSSHHAYFLMIWHTESSNVWLTLELFVSISGNFLTIALMVGSRALSEKKWGLESGLPSIWSARNKHTTQH